MGLAVSIKLIFKRSNQSFFQILPKILETCFVSVNNDFYDKITHFYYFLHTNNFLTKILQTGHSENKNKLKRETGSNQDFEI